MPSTEAQAYWDAAEQGVLLLKHCADCGRSHHYPRSLCPFCFSGNTDWVRASGRGEIYSFSVARRASPPYAVAYVQLEEGLLMLTHIVGCPLDAIRIGQAVELRFERADGKPARACFAVRATEPTT